jgi:undecaprenyl-diphosphatase
VWTRVANDPRLAEFRWRHARLWTFIAARFAPEEYLGLHLTIGLALSLGALWIFAGITEDVVNHDPLTVLDLRIADWFVARATSGGQNVAVAFSLAGSPVSMAALALAGAAILALRKRWVLFTGWLAAFAGGGVLDWALKVTIRRPRPPGAEAFLHGASFSFPSGHSMGSLIGFGMLAYLLVAFVAQRWWAKIAIGVAGGLLVLAIGLSRLYLGVHYFSDVIGGFAAGTVWLSACISGCEVALRQKHLTPWEVGLDRRRTPRATAPPHPTS